MDALMMVLGNGDGDQLSVQGLVCEVSFRSLAPVLIDAVLSFLAVLRYVCSNVCVASGRRHYDLRHAMKGCRRMPAAPKISFPQHPGNQAIHTLSRWNGHSKLLTRIFCTRFQAFTSWRASLQARRL